STSTHSRHRNPLILTLCYGPVTVIWLALRQSTPRSMKTWKASRRMVMQCHLIPTTVRYGTMRPNSPSSWRWVLHELRSNRLMRTIAIIIAVLSVMALACALAYESGLSDAAYDADAIRD